MESTHKTRTEFSKDDWITPEYFYKLLDNEFHFTLDPASDQLNHKTQKYYTIKENGLIYSWENEIVFVNPPFKHKELWIEKCYKESLKSNIIIVLIIPVTSETQDWFDFIWNNKADEIRFCYKRVNFEMPNSEENKDRKLSSSTFPLSIIIYRNPRKNLETKLSCFKHR